MNQHTFTRTHTIKPTVRLRQSPEQTIPPELPEFPPPHVTLHPDDSASKILLAIGRSFMSVDNKAMTIKDLSEMTMTMGYNCQHVSAASQAITTYIRAHLMRCETQQDQPLLLKHTLSGTAADDDLLPALHSTSGGQVMSSESRVTNFRRGTVVWYLSRVTGAPCPFSRAGIRLSTYADLAPPPKKRKELEQCGQKRKRRSSRECVLKQRSIPASTRDPSRSPSPLSSVPDTDDEGESDESSDSEQPPPAKVKLTLKLPPLARVRQEAAAAAAVLYRRSPSVPYSVASAASPPPDSDEETSDESSDEEDSEGEIDLSMDVDVEVNVQGSFPEDFDEDEAQFSDEWDDDNDDEELSTTWESPGPRSPSAQPPTFRVKEEPQDVQGLLDQWEYDLDVKETLVKTEDPPYPAWDWEWDSSYQHGPSSSPSNSSATSMSSPSRIKEEDDFDFSLSFSGPSFTDWRQPSVLSPTTPFGFTLGDESDIFPMSPGAFPVSPTSPTNDYPTFRPRSRTVPSLSLSGFLPPETPSRSSELSITNSLSSLVHSLSMNSPAVRSPPHPLFGPNLSSVFSESEEDETRSEPRTAKELPPPCVSPNDIRIGHDDTDSLGGPGPIVVNTCEPCIPQIFATHIAGIAVYQSSLGPHTLLRRIDTDFVNLTPIIKYAQTPQPVIGAITGATVVKKGKQEVRGLWVPLEAVRLYVKDCITSMYPDPAAILDVFLSDSLVERFPMALREFVRTTRDSLTKGPLARQFGMNFGEMTSRASSSSSPAGPPNPTLIAAAAAKDRMSVSPSPSPSAPLGISMSMVPPKDYPLSPTEEEIFDELSLRTALPLVRSPDRSTKTRSRARKSPSPPTSPLSSCPPSPVLEKAELRTPTSSSIRSSGSATSQPMRRSKRVADALAAKSTVRTRSSNRGSRNLS
ncbi:hypothetical protein BT96DRAFT_1014873 [Gymnopus androsaceus JB14]|uniref:GDS1 winged helix domain-containing protein n=1 Tax=Gymnopus androsaceus JB14 TaxID=1447944 RepID=A0A6A4ICA4_9AGAR|nr:hypothetical protein BT96DRAFT_1014873 [Gymnopus androsaceus JB14]